SEEHTSELQSHLNLVCVFCLRSEEHTSELQSHLNLVCRLLLEKKNTLLTSRVTALDITRHIHYLSLLFCASLSLPTRSLLLTYLPRSLSSSFFLKHPPPHKLPPSPPPPSLPI